MRQYVNSFADYAEAKGMNLPDPAATAEKVRKCNKCGSPMEHVAGSNVYICHGTITKKDKQGNETKEPCHHYALAK